MQMSNDGSFGDYDKPLESEMHSLPTSTNDTPRRSKDEDQFFQQSLFEGPGEPPSHRISNDGHSEITQNLVQGNSQYTTQGPDQQACLPHIEGIRLWVLIAVLCLGLLLATLDTTIIGTALISISSDLGDYGRSNWIVAAYLITYTGFLVIFARLSDIFGRRSTFLVALIIFVIFSLACGLAQTVNQLIVFRAFQGIGGAGLYSLAMSVATEVPGKVRGPIQGLLSSMFAIASAAGPVAGGAITSNTTWRWVFLMNVPIGSILIIVAFWIFPKNAVPLIISFRTLGRVDWPGIILSLSAAVLLIFALQQGGNKYSWSSAPIIVTLVVQGVCWVAFVVWEVMLTKKGARSRMLPVWPSRLFARRVIGSAMLSAFLVGIPFYSIMIFLPQRFQLENSLSPVQAGVRMLVVLVVSSIATGLAAYICIFKNIMFPLIVIAIAFQVLGLGLMSSLPTTGDIVARQYGFQAIVGFGFGVSMSVLPLIARMEVGHLDHSVNMAAVSQIRTLGGVIGVAIGDVILSARVWSKLGGILDPQQVAALQVSTDNLLHFTSQEISSTRQLFGAGYNFEIRVTMYITIACFLVSLGCYVRHPIEIKDLEVMEIKAKELVQEQIRGEPGVMMTPT